MKVKVIKKHPSEWPFQQFPTFKKGTALSIAEKSDSHFLHWHACEIAGHETFVPECFVCNDVLTRDYNPTELRQEVGDILEVEALFYAWLFAKNEKGETGWIPAEVVLSL